MSGGPGISRRGPAVLETKGRAMSVAVAPARTGVIAAFLASCPGIPQRKRQPGICATKTSANRPQCPDAKTLEEPECEP